MRHKSIKLLMYAYKSNYMYRSQLHQPPSMKKTILQQKDEGPRRRNLDPPPRVVHCSALAAATLCPRGKVFFRFAAVPFLPLYTSDRQLTEQDTVLAVH